MHVVLAAESSGGLGALGLNVSGLIFQLINFGLLYFVLQKYAFPAILRLLENRRKVIEAGLKDAEAAKLARSEAETERRKVLEVARGEAGNLVETARSEAKKEAERIMAEAHASANATVSNAEARVEREKREARESLMAELGEVVAAATATVTRGEVTPKSDAAVIKRALQEVK